LSEGERRTGELEYVRKVKYHVEDINGVKVTSFEGTLHKVLRGG